MVGEAGKVIAVEVQDEMLQVVREKAIKEGLESRIITFKSVSNKIGILNNVDFALSSLLHFLESSRHTINFKTANYRKSMCIEVILCGGREIRTNLLVNMFNAESLIWKW
jgi:hypothetical protein